MVLRKIAKFLAGTIFTFSLALFIVLVSLYNLTTYDTLRPLSTGLFLEQADSIEPVIKEACKNSKSLEFNLQNEKVSVDCSELGNLSLFADNAFARSYFKNYTCDILDCIKQPAVLASATGNSLIWNLAIISGIIFVVSAAALLLLLDKKIKGLGISLVLVGINYFILLISKSSVPSTNIPSIDNLISSFFASLMTNFLYVLIIGIALTGIGFYMKK